MDEVMNRLIDLDLKLNKISKQNQILMWGLLALTTMIISMWYSLLSGIYGFSERLNDLSDTFNEFFDESVNTSDVSLDEFKQVFILDTVILFLTIIGVTLAGYMITDASKRFIIPWIKKSRSKELP